jgi:tetratricopeptide (TPR) repeat protein
LRIPSPLTFDKSQQVSMKVIHKKEKWILSLLLFLLFSLNITGQQTDSQSQQTQEERSQFRIARKLMQADKYDRAAVILEKLYQIRPGSEQYYGELLQALLNLSRTDEALNLVKKQKMFDPLNPRYEIDYGSVIYNADRQKEAMKVWKTALDMHKNNVAVFTLVANAMLNQNLYDEAIDVYKMGYETHPERIYFLQNIANIYRSRFENSKALEFYLEYLEKAPNLYVATMRQVLSMDIEDNELEDLASLIAKEAKKFPEIPEIRILLAKFYQKYQAYKRALSVYESLEDNKSQGKYLLDFGRAMQADSLFELALRSYGTTIRRFPESPFLLTAYLGAARSNLELARSKNDQKFAEQAIVTINLVREKYPDHPKVAELSLVEGLIYKEFFFDIDNAIRVFMMISDSYTRNPEIFEKASLLLGECYLMKGDLDEAEAAFKKIQSNTFAANALILLAKIEFYRGNYSECKADLDRVIQLQGTEGTVTNDALELQVLLAEAKSSPGILALYARADLLLFQDKKSEAISKLESALEKNPSLDLKARLLLKAARLSREIGKSIEAIDFCNKLISDSTMISYADEALFLMANVVERDIGDPARAFQLYDRLLVEFPESQFSHAARTRLGKIRNQMEEAVP